MKLEINKTKIDQEETEIEVKKEPSRVFLYIIITIFAGMQIITLCLLFILSIIAYILTTILFAIATPVMAIFRKFKKV